MDVGLCTWAEREGEFKKEERQDGRESATLTFVLGLYHVVSRNLQNNPVKWVLVFTFYLRGSKSERTQMIFFLRLVLLIWSPFGNPGGGKGLSWFCQLPQWEAQASGLEKLAKKLHFDPLICFRSLLSAQMADLICLKLSLGLVSPSPLLDSPSLSPPYPQISISVCFLMVFISQILKKKSLNNLTKIHRGITLSVRSRLFEVGILPSRFLSLLQPLVPLSLGSLWNFYYIKLFRERERSIFQEPLTSSTHSSRVWIQVPLLNFFPTPLSVQDTQRSPLVLNQDSRTSHSRTIW